MENIVVGYCTECHEQILTENMVSAETYKCPLCGHEDTELEQADGQ